MLNRRSRAMCSAICVLLALMLFVSCAEPPAATGNEQNADAEYFSLSGSAYAVISMDAEDDQNINKARELLSEACEAYTNTPIKTADDWYGDEMERYGVEILIGVTNRPESVEAAEGLSYLDYSYKVVSPSVVVICGGSGEATFDAMERFLKDCYGYEDQKSKGELKDIAVGTSYDYRHSYDIGAIELCGSPIDTYTIVHKNDKTSKAAAEQLSLDISRACGVRIERKLNTQYSGGNAIFLGMAKPDGSHADRSYGSLEYAAIFEENGSDKRLFLDSTVSSDVIAAAFSNHYVRNTETEKLEMDFNGDILTTLHKNTDNRLSLYTTLEEKKLDEGVRYRKLYYKDRDGAPVIVYVLEAELSKVSLINATPSNGEVTSGVKANTKEAMEALRGAGYTVIGGVNADFFDMNGDHSPRGLCIKNGKLLHEASKRPWFGIKSDGAPIIGTAAEYAERYDGQLKEAVGGSSIILRAGEYFDVGKTESGYYTEMSYTRHPRTSVGFTNDGRLLLVVVDGRSEESNGASFTDLADIMLELGATDAINLDGGGSSTMVTYGEDDGYVTRNVPSDGSLRSLYNSLVIVKK